MDPQMTMPDEGLNWADAAADELRRSANQFDFFQAIRRIESIAADLPRVGDACQAKQEAVRIRQTAALDFAPATIDRIDQDRDGRARLNQRFFGLLGPSGPMPLHMTEQVRDQVRHDKDTTLESFLSLFHHRMATLFYRAWRSSRGAVQRDRPAEDRFAIYVGALSGAMPRIQGNVETAPHTDSPSQHPNASINEGPSETRWHFAGRFGTIHRNGEGLEAIVSSTIGAPAKVTNFVLRRLRLQCEDRTLLSTTKSPKGRGGQLGRSVVLGRTVADRRSLISLNIGPVQFPLFQRLLPGGTSHQTLRHLIRSYVDPGLDCRVRLILDHQTVPRMSLGREGTLGRSAWVRSHPPQDDVGDCQFLI